MTEQQSFAQTKCFCAMAGRNRLTPDPSVSVADICSALHRVTETEGCKDIQKLLHSRTKYTWKSAPDALGLLFSVPAQVVVGLLL